jgi:hypothetical protein
MCVCPCDMDAMTMVFKAADPAILKTIKPGEKIKFTTDSLIPTEHLSPVSSNSVNWRRKIRDAVALF